MADGVIHLLPRDVPRFLREGYKGRKFRVKVCLEMTLPLTAGIWCDGSKEEYRICRLRDGETLPVPHQEKAPWSKDRQNRIVQTSPEYIIILETIFQGKHCGLTYYVHPDTVAAGYLIQQVAS